MDDDALDELDHGIAMLRDKALTQLVLSQQLRQTIERAGSAGVATFAGAAGKHAPGPAMLRVPAMLRAPAEITATQALPWSSVLRKLQRQPRLV